MKYVVFGSSGFLGSSILSYLPSSQALGINNMSDIDLINLNQFQIFINCAGASNVNNSFQDPINDFNKNTILVEQLLEIIRVSGNKKIKFINISSAAVYGNPQFLPIVEFSNIEPISPYGFHKKMAEDLCRYYNQCFGLNTLSLRVFSAYGEGQRKMLFWDLHNKILNSIGNIELFGTGEESRDFIHIEDIIQQIILAINHADFTGEAINVANGTEVRIKEIVELYRKFHPNSFSYSFNGKNRPGDPLNWCADISKMKEWGYDQKVSLYDGVDGYIKWVIANKLLEKN